MVGDLSIFRLTSESLLTVFNHMVSISRDFLLFSFISYYFFYSEEQIVALAVGRATDSRFFQLLLTWKCLFHISFSRQVSLFDLYVPPLACELKKTAGLIFYIPF